MIKERKRRHINSLKAVTKPNESGTFRSMIYPSTILADSIAVAFFLKKAYQVAAQALKRDTPQNLQTNKILFFSQNIFVFPAYIFIVLFFGLSQSLKSKGFKFKFIYNILFFNIIINCKINFNSWLSTNLSTSG